MLAQGTAAGQLTACETNDCGKWGLWNDISKEGLTFVVDATCSLWVI
jgi:hypothetical protein